MYDGIPEDKQRQVSGERENRRWSGYYPGLEVAYYLGLSHRSF